MCEREVPVIERLPDGTRKVIWIRYGDILGWGLEKNDTTCFTLTHTYLWPDTLDKLELIQGCERTERASVIKMDKVVRYDRNLQTLHFRHDQHHPFVTVSRGHRRRLNLD